MPRRSYARGVGKEKRQQARAGTAAPTRGICRRRRAASAPRVSPAAASGRSRPSRQSACSSTAAEPARERRVRPGSPSAAASRFIVPPAETARSASATRLGASTARSGTCSPGRPTRADRRALLGRARQHDRVHRLVAPEPVEHAVRRAGCRAGGRATRPAVSARPTSTFAGSTPSSAARIGLEVRKVVLLLDPRVSGASCGGSGPEAGSRRSGGDRRPERPRASPPAARADAAGSRTRSRARSRSGSRGSAPRASTRASRARARGRRLDGCREAAERGQPSRQRACLSDRAGAAVRRADDVVADPVQLEQLERLGVLPRGYARPRARRLSSSRSSGRKNGTCGEFVMSIQTRTRGESIKILLMDPRRLAAFCAVVERRSFAEQQSVSVTRLAVFLQCERSRKRLGTQLLDRSGRHVEPTEAGLRPLPRRSRCSPSKGRSWTRSSPRGRRACPAARDGAPQAGGDDHAAAPLRVPARAPRRPDRADRRGHAGGGRARRRA